MSFAAKGGGTPTHVADGDGYFDRPQAGTSVVWFVTGEQGTESWQLWSRPGRAAPAGRPAASRPNAGSSARTRDVAWVFARGTVKRIQRE